MNVTPLALSGLLLVAIAGGPPPTGPAAFAGTYGGSLWSSGRDTPSTTTLEAAGGLLTGRYSFEDLDGSTATGRLDACRIEGLTVTCLWHDSYGTGPLGMNFDPSHCSFKGEWAASIVARDWAPIGMAARPAHR
ncbi:hypothetical protein GCM10007874_65350 [Labrys miyagiensis]|uniref:Uncharacterized protein n=1 Tax=Labrys miyagiensis TaxID=346912 RepID=A0ABQ6CTS3_9HYPH|nr:hypothetical protein [Labrys miyagiensis]GLS23514.1 hypothetical protein GCM10007874_65350 [Labrys miyagiensis]